MDIRNFAFELYRQSLDSTADGRRKELPEELSAHDRAFVLRLVQTTLRRQEFFKKIAARYGARKISARPDAAQTALLLGMAEILYFDTPDYAAVNSYVALAKRKSGRFAGGFVNAVLRKICSDAKELSALTPLPFFPPAFRKMLTGSLTKTEIDAVERASLTEPPLDITARENPEDLCAALGGTLLANGSIRLTNAGSVRALPGYEKGAWWVQDFSASLPVISLGDVKGKTALDICAAPGGKTAQLLAKGARVTALDISAARLQTLAENLARLRLTAENVVAADALKFLPTAPKFDIVLLDAPCSADGTLRRHPEIVHTRTAADVAGAVPLQQKLLTAAAEAVKPGGTLLYAVCSMCRAEGEEQIRRFLKNRKDFAVAPVSATDICPFAPGEAEPLLTKDGFIRCRPDIGAGMDGFFAARLTRGADITVEEKTDTYYN